MPGGRGSGGVTSSGRRRRERTSRTEMTRSRSESRRGVRETGGEGWCVGEKEENAKGKRRQAEEEDIRHFSPFLGSADRKNGDEDDSSGK